MKNFKTLILITFLFFQLSSTAQENFEGIVKFKFEYHDKTEKMSDDQTKQFMGTEQLYYLKKGKYKSVMNGLLEMTSFHNGNDTLYVKMNGANSLLYSPTNDNDNEEVISFKFKKTSIKIAGYNCELLIVKTNKGDYQYFFNRSVRIDPSYYKNHKLGLWSFFMEKTNGSISLKQISNIDDSLSTIEVISIEKKKIDEAIFERPNLPIMKMPKN